MIRIFITLGTQKFPFARLIDAFNTLVERGVYSADEILIQSTVYPVEPKFRKVGLVSSEEFIHCIQESEVIVAHAGVNSILSCMQLGKPLVVVPRLFEFGEHVDNHQTEIAELLEKKYDMLILSDMTQLESAIEKAKTHKYKQFVSHRDMLIEAIKALIV